MTNTKERKHFKFYRSYYDVFCELPNDKEKVSFIEAIFKKQFFNIDTQLKGMAKFAYVSQKHNIENQVQGFIDMKGIFSTPYEGAIQGAMVPPSMEPVTDNIQHIIYNQFEIFWSSYPKKVAKADTVRAYSKVHKEYENIMKGLKKFCTFHKSRWTEKQFIMWPAVFLNGRRWEDEFDWVQEARPAYDPLKIW